MPTLKWKKHDNYAIKSDCGRYSICSIGFNGGRFFEVWRTRAHESGPHLVAHNIADAKEARKLAEADSRE